MRLLSRIGPGVGFPYRERCQLRLIVVMPQHPLTRRASGSDQVYDAYHFRGPSATD